MKYEIVVNAPGSPYEKIAGPFPSREAAEKYASEEKDPMGDGGTIADAIQGGEYRISATR